MGAEATVKSKKYAYDYDQYKDGEKGPGTLIEDILADPEFLGLTEIVIGDWGNTWEESCQSILDVIAEQSDRFSILKAYLSETWAMRNAKYPGLSREITAGCGRLCRN